MAARLSALRAGRFLPPGRFLVLISDRVWVDPRAIVQLERLGKLKKSTSSETRTCDLPACSIVPQPITLPRAPFILVGSLLILLCLSLPLCPHVAIREQLGCFPWHLIFIAFTTTTKLLNYIKFRLGSTILTTTFHEDLNASPCASSALVVKFLSERRAFLVTL
jgi:hypothetical protein